MSRSSETVWGKGSSSDPALLLQVPDEFPPTPHISNNSPPISETLIQIYFPSPTPNNSLPPIPRAPILSHPSSTPGPNPDPFPLQQHRPPPKDPAPGPDPDPFPSPSPTPRAPILIHSSSSPCLNSSSNFDPFYTPHPWPRKGPSSTPCPISSLNPRPDPDPFFPAAVIHILSHFNPPLLTHAPVILGALICAPQPPAPPRGVPALTVRTCRRSMYNRKLHSLVAKATKVRSPSRHWVRIIPAPTPTPTPPAPGPARPSSASFVPAPGGGGGGGE